MFKKLLTLCKEITGVRFYDKIVFTESRSSDDIVVLAFISLVRLSYQERRRFLKLVTYLLFGGGKMFGPLSW